MPRTREKPPVIPDSVPPTTYSAWLEKNPLRAWRVKRNINIAQCATLLKTSAGSVKNWENGSCNPNALGMARIAAALRVPQMEMEARWKWWHDSAPIPEGGLE